MAIVSYIFPYLPFLVMESWVVYKVYSILRTVLLSC